jgi:hypothetical protein
MAGEINEAMGRSYAIPDDVDESDLMAELDALEADLAVEPAGKEGPSYLQVRVANAGSQRRSRACNSYDTKVAPGRGRLQVPMHRLPVVWLAAHKPGCKARVCMLAVLCRSLSWTCQLHPRIKKQRKRRSCQP